MFFHCFAWKINPIFVAILRSCAEVRENTIASLKTAASHGADFVEFDVQLSKDLVPVIYHDFYVCISMKKKNQTDEVEMLQLPLKELTLEQLHLLKVIQNNSFTNEKLVETLSGPSWNRRNTSLSPHVLFGAMKNRRLTHKDHTCCLSQIIVNPKTTASTINIQCSPANPAQAGEEAVGLADLSGLPSSFCVLVGE